MLVTTQNNIFLRYSKAPISNGDIWIIHGFSESGLSFKNVFESSIAGVYNVWIPDLPGFGASPYQDQLTTIHEYVELLTNLIGEKSKNQKKFLIGHSFGSVIACLLCEKPELQISGLASVEGNLTEADFYFSGWAGQYEDGEQFQKKFKALLLDKAKDRSEFEHYFAAATIADPKALTALGRSSCDFSKSEDAGNRFLSVKCPIFYLWGDVDTPPITQKFIKERLLNNYHFAGGTHWMMKEYPVLFYSVVLSFLNQL
ncbi:MAG TPA: alpha/beta hydrolase [Puia sp.]